VIDSPSGSQHFKGLVAFAWMLRLSPLGTYEMHEEEFDRMMRVDSVSVVVPHYNRPDLVPAAIRSILNQSVKPSQILLIDDCSTSENREKLKPLSSFATIMTTPRNLGLAGARQFGAQCAKSEWIAFLDDDDTWLPDKLERQIRYLETHPNVVALGGGTTVRTPDGQEEYWGEKLTYRVNLAHALLHTASLVPALLIRRDVLLKIGGFDESLRYLEDYDFGIRLIASGYETHFLGESLFIYNRGGRTQASFQHTRMFQAEIRILEKHADLVRKEFGAFGPVFLKARCCKKYGLRIGGVKGRLIWGWGSVLEAAIGQRLVGIEEQAVLELGN
jgi:GT2 family glycosyltransferase